MYFSHKMFPAEVEIPEVSFSKFLKSIQSNVYRINVLFRKPWNNSVVKTFIIIIKDIFIEIQYNLYKNVFYIKTYHSRSMIPCGRPVNQEFTRQQYAGGFSFALLLFRAHFVVGK